MDDSPRTFIYSLFPEVYKYTPAKGACCIIIYIFRSFIEAYTLMSDYGNLKARTEFPRRVTGLKGN
jgi:hypothetical protein